MSLKKILFVELNLIAPSGTAAAQILVSSSLRGFVQEEEGSIHPRVGITITLPALLVAQMATNTNDRGFNPFPVLPPSRCKMSSVLQGFNELVREACYTFYQDYAGGN